MILRADQGGWIGVPTRDFRRVAFDFSRQERITPDGEKQIFFTLTPLTEEQVAAIEAEELRLYGPPSECEGIDAKISARVAREAAREAKRSATEHAGEQAARPAGAGGPTIRLVR